MASMKTVVLSLLVAQLTLAWPKPPLRANIHERQADIADEYDYVIVGGGTAGLTVGDRLTEDENCTNSVLVIEVGLYHNETGMNAARMFNITSEPSPQLNDRSFFVGIGKAVGGSSIVNGQVMLRGTAEEYDAWKTLGGKGSTWDWKGLLPYFKKGLALSPPTDEIAEEYKVQYDLEYWGDNAPIYGTYGPQRPPEYLKKLYEAMAGMPGMTIAPDSGSGDSGLYWYPTSQDPETWERSYARTGHWDNVPRDNYDMIVGAKVDHVVLNKNNAATGVRFASVNATEGATKFTTVKARKEVIIAAGTIHTPQVLMLSGVGPADALESSNLPVKVDLPGVGANFQDHAYIPSIGFEWGNPPETEPFGGLNAAPNLVAMVGLPVLSPDRFESLAQSYEEQDPTEHLPSSYTEEQVAGYAAQQALYAQLMRSPGTTFNEMMMFQPGGSIQLMHPASRGLVTLNTDDPHGEVIVDYRAATNAIDLDIFVEEIRFMRRYMASEALASFEPAELSPGANVTTTAQLRKWVRSRVIPSVYHPIGTCAKMPRELGGCVDEELLVYGTKKLSVVDASVMPTLIGATTQQSVYAIAEKAADIIKARTQGSL